MTQEIVIISANRSPKHLTALIAAAQAQYPGVTVTVEEPDIKGYSADLVCLDEIITEQEIAQMVKDLGPEPEYLPDNFIPKKRNHPTSPRQRGGR